MRHAGLCALAALLASTLAGCQQAPAANEHVCSGALAISASDLTGTSLPPKTLALTFDDGPGPRTSELSTFLESHGVSAGFFVNGKMIHDDVVLKQLIADGHVIGNHTQTHASLTGQSTGSWHLDDATTVSELAQTDALIAPFVVAERFMFRAPYGDFDASSANAINNSAMSKYVGNIHWSIGDHMGAHQAADWDCWQPGSDGVVVTVARCAELYLEEIESVGRGIVLMHDPYFIDGNPGRGGTVDMVESLVPLLQSKGYSFVRVDEVPEIAARLPPLPPSIPPTDHGSSGGGNGGSGSVRRIEGHRSTHLGWATMGSGEATSAGSGATHGVVAPSTSPGAPASEAPVVAATASGGKPDPCASSPQRNSAD